MCASPLAFLRAGPPPPKVALLPDAMFFTRAVPIAAGVPAAEAASQIELALESLAPFPLAQLYYGWFWTPGAEHALVFAAYRRRFTSDQVAFWEGAELVLPAFASVVGAKVAPSTTVVLTSPEGLTAVHWDKPEVPSKVVFRPLDPEATEEDRLKARDDLLRDFEGSKKVIELPTAPLPESARSDREIVFSAGDFVSIVPATAAAAIDVRDKAELAAIRAGRKRDVLLWQVTLAAVAALVLFAVGELALIGGKQWQKVRRDQVKNQQPIVDRISNMQELTNRIDDLRTKQLLPLEMVTQLVGENSERKPDEVQFSVVQADTSRGLYSVYVTGRSSNAALVNSYEKTLQALPSVEKAEAQIQAGQGTSVRFTLNVTFKNNALRPTTASVASTP